MLTIITGTPGAGKSLYTVWEEARRVPGSTVEMDGQAVPRRLLSNIKNLLLDHEHIDAHDLETWHEWAKPGDVIVFDEVQEVWRPRGLGSKVPECIAALETHRHKGVDIILITQHPMLVDPNIRRLCNRHLHLRRLMRTVAYVYEWDHCANPGQVKTALDGRLWRHPKKAYALYKSAQLHTKPTARLPRLAIVGLLAVAGMAYMAPTAYSRITDRMAGKSSTQPGTTAQAPTATASGVKAAGLPAPHPAQPASAPPPAAVVAAPRVLGCIAKADRCECWDDSGQRAQVSPAMCLDGSQNVGTVVPLATDGGMGARPHGGFAPPNMPTAQGAMSTRRVTGSDAAAVGQTPASDAFNLAPPPERVNSLLRDARQIAS